MDSSVNSHLIAQVVQDRIDEATTARSARAVKAARRPRRIHVRRWLGRRTRVEAPARATVTVLPPS